MEESSFDALAKSLAARISRRSALRAGAAAAIATAGVSQSADAVTCRQEQSICRKHGDCCSGNCLPPDTSGRRRCEHSCFVAGTRVAMADGTSRPIELVGFGDLVLGANGAVSRVIGVETPLLGSRKLYSLNGSEPFVTAEHPFMTADGWKSIDPAATFDEQPDLPVERLRVGDSLIELTELLVPAVVGVMLEPAGIQTRRVALSSIDPTTAAPSTQLYNLLLDGDHTYFANELLVHNKA
ncbi:MAG: hypothetical protein IT336_05605 [Thermomicrobiales bacterium]|nr:hypothetical protein [Thermomicrobiales bacterium]